jgi:hypothetical protein
LDDDPGVADEAPQAFVAAPLGHQCGGAADRFLVGEVELHRDHVAGLLDRLRRPRGREHAPVLLDQGPRQRGLDAAGGAGDEDVSLAGHLGSP